MFDVDSVIETRAGVTSALVEGRANKSKFSVLWELAKGGEVTSPALSATLGIPAETVTAILGDLVAQEGSVVSALPPPPDHPEGEPYEVEYVLTCEMQGDAPPPQ